MWVSQLISSYYTWSKGKKLLALLPLHFSSMGFGLQVFVNYALPQMVDYHVACRAKQTFFLGMKCAFWVTFGAFQSCNFSWKMSLFFLLWKNSNRFYKKKLINLSNFQAKTTRNTLCNYKQMSSRFARKSGYCSFRGGQTSWMVAPWHCKLYQIPTLPHWVTVHTRDYQQLNTGILVLKKTVFLHGRVHWIWIWSTKVDIMVHVNVFRLWDMVFSWRFERLWAPRRSRLRDCREINV